MRFWPDRPRRRPRVGLAPYRGRRGPSRTARKTYRGGAQGGASDVIARDHTPLDRFAVAGIPQSEFGRGAASAGSGCMGIGSARSHFLPVTGGRSTSGRLFSARAS